MKRSGSDAAVMGKVISRASVRVYPSNQNVKPIDNKGKGKQPLIIKKLPPLNAPSCSSSTVKLESKSGLIIKMNKRRMMGVVADDDPRATKRCKPSKITYSRMDLESMRFANFAEQRDLCMYIPQELIFKGFLVPKPKTSPIAPTPMRELILAARKKLDEINERSNKHKPKWIRDRQEFRLMIQEVERRALARPLFQDGVQLMTDIDKLIFNCS